jgi:hypothetical protein
LCYTGHVKIHNEMPKWNAQAKIPTKAEAAAAKKKDEMAPPTPKRRVTGNKLDLRWEGKHKYDYQCSGEVVIHHCFCICCLARWLQK